MKKIFAPIILSLLVVFCATAQLDRSQRPEPGPAPEIHLGEFDSFTLDNGMKVIVVENRQVPVISFQLTLDIDPVMEGEAKGYTSLAGSLMREGTTNRTKEEIDESIDFIGANLSTFATGMFASSLSRHKETLVDLMADVLLNPIFPEEELQRLITRQKSGLATVQNDANQMANNVGRAVAYGPNHPYGENTSPESLENVNLELIRDYYNSFFKPNAAYMVIVGDIDLQEAKELMDEYFAQWEPGEVPTMEYPTPTPPDGRTVSIANRSGAVQSVVAVTYPVELTPGHEDAIKASVMNSVLGGGAFSGRLMQNLREDKGYTYGARSSLSTDPVVGRFNARTEVRNEVTDSTITEILYEMHRMINEPVEESSLELTKNFMTGSFARSLEQPRTIARFALNIERYGLPEDYYATYLERLNAVTAEEVQEMARKYIFPDNAHIVVAGNRDEVIDNIRQFSATGEVDLYDAFGRPVEEPDLLPVPDGITLETVLDNYLEASGGKEHLAAIQDMTTKAKTSVQGMEINITTYQKAPNMVRLEMAMGGNVMQTQVFDGEKAVFSSPMGKQEFTEGPEFDAMKMAAVMNMEMDYEKYGFEKELLGIATIDGQQAYKVESVSPDGQKFQDYYHVETGLKIKEETPQGVTKYFDYKEITVREAQEPSFFARLFGRKTTEPVVLKFPSHMETQAGPQTLEMEVTEIKIDTGLEAEKFSMN